MGQLIEAAGGLKPAANFTNSFWNKKTWTESCRLCFSRCKVGLIVRVVGVVYSTGIYMHTLRAPGRTARAALWTVDLEGPTVTSARRLQSLAGKLLMGGYVHTLWDYSFNPVHRHMQRMRQSPCTKATQRQHCAPGRATSPHRPNTD